MSNEKLLPYIDGLHVLPWLTDGALDFLDSHIFYIKGSLRKNPKVFEFGAGNSTLYFLSRGCLVTSIEHDSEWCQKISDVAACFGYQDRLALTHGQRPYHKEFDMTTNHYDLVLVDGRDRVQCLERVIDELGRLPGDRQPLLILDNTEHVADKYANYLSMLGGFSLLHYEMPFVFGGLVTQSETLTGLSLPTGLPANGLAANAYRDRAGNASKGRWITTIAVPKGRGEFTSQGVPLVQTPVHAEP
jgi:hypothetical protein